MIDFETEFAVDLNNSIFIKERNMHKPNDLHIYTLTPLLIIPNGN